MQTFCAQHASALGLSDRSVRRILHDDLHCHTYKMAIVQELSARVSLHEGTHVRRFSKMFLKLRLFTSVMKHIFIWLDASTNKTCATWLTPIPENCIKGIHLKSQCVVQFPPPFEGSNTKTTNRIIKGLGLMIWRFVFMIVTTSTWILLSPTF